MHLSSFIIISAMSAAAENITVFLSELIVKVEGSVI